MKPATIDIRNTQSQLAFYCVITLILGLTKALQMIMTLDDEASSLIR